MRRVFVISLLLSGCTTAEVSESDEPDHANIVLAAMDDGRPALTVDNVIHPEGKPTTDKSMSLSPGTYMLNLNCWRPGGTGPSPFVVEVEAKQSYILDCQPTANGNGFVLRSVGQ